MAVIDKDLGPVSAYAMAVMAGYTGTEEEFAASIAESGSNAMEAALQAQEAAKSAEDAAKLAEEVAQNASQVAQNASDTVKAKESAEEAKRLSEAAQKAAETAKQAAEDAQSASNKSATNAATAKQGAETALKAAQEAAAAAAKALADLQALYQEMQTWAQGVVQDVNEAGSHAVQSVQSAGDAQVQRVTDEGTAQTANAKAKADAAAQSADSAAQSAQQAAESAAVYDDVVADVNQLKQDIAAVSAVCGTLENTEDGTVIQLTDCVERPLKGLRIFGRTVQDGTPTPDTPIPFVSVGNGGSITVTIETPQNESAPQAMAIDTENGLAGISGTVCDEIDFARGVRIVRFKHKRMSPNLNWNYSSATNRFFVIDKDYKLGDFNVNIPNVVCTHFKAGKGVGDKIICYINDSSNGYAFRYSALNGDVSAWKNFLTNNEVYIIGELGRAIEIPLTTDEISAYSTLHTYKPNTTIYNDADSEMEVGYQADTKLYIDKQFAELRNAIVSLGGNV